METFEAAKELYQRRGLGERLGWGKAPAVLVVDFTNGFTDPSYPTGADVSSAIAETRRLLDIARERKLPILFTAIAYDDPDRDGGHWVRKIPALKALRMGTPAAEVDPRLERRLSEPLIVKRFASAFFGTDLCSRLQFMRVDTLVVCGASTSGCIRATVIDAIQYGFYCIVPETAVADRAEAPHHANLFDMQAKYADVLPTEQVIAELRKQSLATLASASGLPPHSRA
ncbi:MAG: isochorismatase family protein [Acidobacteriia bacterium]|nr:isochorismatase family protein [Methyloceanibacter sp.]MCL6490630.1 isochorismatase family protein [Terriglobia bacterium]